MDSFASASNGYCSFLGSPFYNLSTMIGPFGAARSGTWTLARLESVTRLHDVGSSTFAQDLRMTIQSIFTAAFPNWIGWEAYKHTV